MSNSLREKLLGLGFKAPEPEPRPERAPRPERGGESRKPGGKPPARRDGRPAGQKPGENRARPEAKAGEGRRDGKPDARRRDAKPGQGSGRPRPAKPRTQEEMDLAKAYAIRAQKEKEERIEAERLRQEEARLRREAKAKLAEFLKDKSLNDPAAEIARHFPYGGKIKRIHVTEVQLKALNAGELGVVQLDGRYLLVPAALLAEVESIFAPAVALRVDPDAPAGDDPYADPQYQVPDDLVW
jgi:uncharacterized protein YaiL (DUF2058 family)